jgi:hypothetical protein
MPKESSRSQAVLKIQYGFTKKLAIATQSDKEW